LQLHLMMQEAGTSSPDSSSDPSSENSSSSMAAIEQQLGVKPQDLMQRLMAHPDLLARVQDPEVGGAELAVSMILCGPGDADTAVACLWSYPLAAWPLCVISISSDALQLPSTNW
jgi:hypothetical protein